jgi:hypothetical protein
VIKVGQTFGLVVKDAKDELCKVREQVVKVCEAALLDWGAEGTLDSEGGEFGTLWVNH